MESITGQDVLAYSFAKSRRGYDQAEVDQFVEVIAAELDRLNGLLIQRVGNEESAVLLLRTATRTADETIAEAHNALGYAATFYDWDWASAERELRRAIELNPSYAMAHLYLSWYWNSQGKVDRALESVDRRVGGHR